MTSSLLAPAAGPDLAAAWPRSLQLLLGEAAVDLWTAALAPTGAALRGLRATAVSLRSDGSATVQYAAALEVAGRPARDTLAATTGSRIPPGAAVLAGEVDGVETRVGLWRWPHDPALPALARATSTAAVRRLLGADDATLRVRAYRPGRRAVVEVSAPGARWFLKVVRPVEVAGLVERHRLLTGAVPAPAVLDCAEDGVLVLPALPGTPCRAVLADPAVRPAATTLTTLLDRLPAGLTALPRVRGPLERSGGHAAVLGLVMPHLRRRWDRVAGALADADPGGHDLVPVHGDLYEAQLLVDRGEVTGLLDVDGAGAGHRIDDWATLLGHLAVAGAHGYRAELAAALPWSPAELAPRVAAVALGLATGPFRVQQRGWPRATEARLALVEELLGGA